MNGANDFSVLISLYMGERADYLNKALSSIWYEQRLRPKQIVLVLDGPINDALSQSVFCWKNSLGDIIDIVEISHNVGLGNALNKGLEACKYELIARMDTDDIALPNRFSRQVEFMKEHPDISASSAVLEEWDETLRRCIGVRRLPCHPDDLKKFAKRRCPLSHPLAIYRKSAVLSVGGYPPLAKAQDYGLWAKLLSSGYSLANLPDTLLRMRAGKSLYARRGYNYFKHEVRLLKYQRSIGFLDNLNYVINFSIKFSVRLMPLFLKQYVYRIFR